MDIKGYTMVRKKKKENDDPNRPVKLLKTVKTFLKTHVRSDTIYDGSRSLSLKATIETLVLQLSPMAQRASKLFNAALLCAHVKGQLHQLNFDELQTIFNHALEFSSVNKHILIAKPFDNFLKEAYEIAPANWDALWPNTNALNDFDGTMANENCHRKRIRHKLYERFEANSSTYGDIHDRLLETTRL